MNGKNVTAVLQLGGQFQGYQTVIPHRLTEILETKDLLNEAMERIMIITCKLHIYFVNLAFIFNLNYC